MKFPSLSSILIGKHYISIEHFSFNNEEMISILQIENKKEGLAISKRDMVTYKGLIAEKWDRKIPYILTINTNQVIQKEIEIIDIADEKLLHKAFPNTNWDEFYFEIWRLQTKSIIAICRKTYTDVLLESYTKQGISIAGMSLGICSLSEIITYCASDTFLTNHQTVSWNENTPILTLNTNKSELTYSINDLDIQNSNLLAFSGVLRFLIKATNTSGTIIESSEKLYDQYLQQIFFSKGLKTMIGILLGILLINFFVFSHYYHLSQETEVNLLLNKSSLEEISKTKQRLFSKEQKLKNVMAGSQSQSTALLNEITKRVPTAVLLTELVYQPLEKKIKSDEAITLLDKVIIASGTTVNNQDFTGWIEAINQLKWVDEVVITHFGKNETNQTEFSIKLTLK